MASLRKQLLATEVLLAIKKKETKDFEEEKLVNHIMYSIEEYFKFLRSKKNGSSDS
jgi:hypothetical protein